jgi:hemoglobin-like flavoprotein
MEEALVDTLRAQLGDAMTAETEAAWRAAYRDLADEIVARGQIQ